MNAYRYHYANPTEVGPRQPLQLEFWYPKGRKGGAWVPQHLTFGLKNARPGCFRRVVPGHSHADKLAHSIASVKGGYARDMEEQIKAYLDGAHRAGLTTVHAFKGCKFAAKWAPSYFLSLACVDPSEFIGPAPAPTEDVS